MRRMDIAATVLVVGLLMLVGMSVTAQQRRRSADSVCMLNLKDLATAIRNFNTETTLDYFALTTREGVVSKTTPTQFLRDLAQSEPLQPKKLICPADDRVVARSFTELSTNNLSYFFSSQLEDCPSKKILAGDRNIKVPAQSGKSPFEQGVVQWAKSPVMHTNSGWLVLWDTSVLKATNEMRLAAEVFRANKTNLVIVP